jgi:uncharacterized membrane protein
MSTNKEKKYWKKNLKYLTILLSIWFLVSFVFGILLVEELNTIRVGGFKLGCFCNTHFCVHQTYECIGQEIWI